MTNDAHKPLNETPVPSNQFGQLLIRYMQDGFSVLDLNGVALDVNPALCKMTGFSRDELIGVGPPHPYWPPEEYDHIHAALNETLRGGVSEFELNFMRKNGERFPVIVSPFAVKNRDGETVSYSATVKDITERRQFQVALQESEKRYRRIVETAEEGVWTIDEKQITSYVNPKMAQMLGYTVEEMTGRELHSFMDEEGRIISDRNVKRREQGINEQHDFKFQRKDGTALWALLSTNPIMRDDGSYAGALAMVTDITERKRAEIEKAQEQKVLELVARGGPLPDVLERILLHYETIFSGLLGSVLLLDPDGKHLRHGAAPHLPPTYCRAIDGAEIGPRVGSCGTAAYTGKTVMVDDIATDPLWQVYKHLALAHGLRACWSVPIRGTKDQVLGTFAFYHHSPRAAMPSELTAIERGAHLVGMAIERDYALSALQKSEERFRGLFESAGDAILILQGDQFVDCNDRALELFGCSSRDQIIGHGPFVLFPLYQPNGRASREYAIEKIAAVRSGQPQFFEWLHTRFDGTPFSSEVSLSVPRLGDTSIIQAIIHDITERKQMEEALRELNKDLEHRVAQRTRELENAYDELLKRNSQFRALAEKLSQTENAERRRIARLLHDNYQQLLVAAKFKAEILLGDEYDDLRVKEISRQVLDILDQSIEASRSLTMELAPPILHDAGFAAGMHWLARWMLEKHHLEVALTGSAPLTPLPMDLSILLFEAVRELLFNVSKHSGVTMAVVTMTPVDDGFRISVTDEGKGFDIAHVLETPRTFGLFNIRERLALLDGKLTLISAPGQGTNVVLFVPLKIAVMPPATLRPAPKDQITEPVLMPRAVPDRIRILVADDHAVVREGLVQILSREKDMDIVGEAVDGLDAVEQTRSLRPDVVLMDITMPRLNGLEATLRITSEIPGVRVIGLSMHAKDEMQPQMRAVGAVGYLAKNNPVEELIAAIREVMAAEHIRA